MYGITTHVGTHTHSERENTAHHEILCSINALPVSCCSFQFGVLLLTCLEKFLSERNRFKIFRRRDFNLTRPNPSKQNRLSTWSSRRELPNTTISFVSQSQFLVYTVLCTFVFVVVSPQPPTNLFLAMHSFYCYCINRFLICTTIANILL